MTHTARVKLGESGFDVVLDRELSFLLFDLQDPDTADLSSGSDVSAATAMHRLVTKAHRPDAILFGQMARHIICDELVDGLLHALGSQRLRVDAWLKNDPSFTGPSRMTPS
ncbi:hypothetical protein PQR09_12055 [Paraburkholderia sediminicola]